MTTPSASVSVSVTPDARDFWVKFQQQTRTDAAAAGAQAGRDYRQGFDQEVTRAAPRIRPDIDTSQTDAQLARLRANLQRGFNVDLQNTGMSAAQVASLTAATNRLTDAQDALKRARTEQAAVAAKEGVTSDELAAAAAKVARAQRDEELGALRLAAAQETVASSQQRAAAAAAKAQEKLQAQSSTTSDTNKVTFSLAQLLGTLAPALVPIAGAAATATAGFGALGVAGVLAVKGIKDEIKSGTAVGVQYAAQVQVAKNALGSLQKTAATNFLGGFQSSVGKLSTQLPAFNVAVGQSSKALGQISSNVTGGLVAGFTTFAPVINAAEQAFVKLSAQFEKFASTANGQKFAQDLVADFQQVVPLVENLAGALAKLVVAAAPVGGALVSTISDLAAALNAIPTPVLTALVTTFTALSAGRLASGLLARLPLALSATGAAAGSAASSTGLLAVGLSRLVPIVAGVVAANIGLKAADNATSSWATSSNALAAGLHNSVHAVGELFSGNFAKGASDLVGDGAEKAKVYRENVLAIQSALGSLITPSAKAQASLSKVFGGGLSEAAQAQAKSIAKNLQSTATTFINPNSGKSTTASVVGKGGILTVGQQLDSARVKEYTKDLKVLTDTQANFYNQAARSTSISTLSGTYTTQATALQKVAAAQLANISAGDKAVDTYRGVKIGSDAYNAALAKTGGNTATATGLIEGQIDSYLANTAAVKQTATESQRLGQVVGATAAKYKLTSDQIDLYTQVAGINTDAVAKGTITQREFSAAIGAVASAVNNGSTSVSEYVAAIAQFNSTADTAASRGALIGATLKAANGPLLSYANTMVQAATANQQLVTDFGSASKSILNLKKGTIDFHNAAAAPLLNDLSNLQTAAVNSAAATYQYETSQGKASASSDAFKVYVNDTKGALEKEASQMGLSKTQADKLATSYFGIKNSGDLKKQIGLIGSDKVLDALHAILEDLNILAGKTVNTYVYTHYEDVKGSKIGTGTKGNDPRLKAAGGFIAGPGSATSDSIPAMLSNGEYVVNAAQTGKHRQLLEALNAGVQGFASGGLVHLEAGGFTGVDYSGSKSSSSSSGGSSSSASSSKAAAAAKKTASDLAAALKTARSALSSFLGSLSGSASSINSASAALISAAKNAKATQHELAVLSSERSRLGALASRRDSVAARLGSAPSAPTAYDKLATAQQAYSDTKTSVASAFTGGFNISTAGVNAQVYNDVAAAPVSAASILSDLKKQAGDASKFGAALKTLAKGGLPKALLLQLAQAGPTALPQALALEKATPAQILGIKAQYGTLTTAASTAGTLLATDLNGAGVAAAKGLIAGLKSQEAALKKQMQHLADVMAAQIKKDLKIHSPSQVFHEFGVNTGEGLRLGIESKYGAVASATRGLAGAASPIGGLELRGSGSAASGGVNLNVYPAASLDEVAVGNVAANRLQHALAGL